MIRQFPDKTILDPAFRETYPIPEKTMAELLYDICDARPDARALSFLGARLSFGDLKNRIDTCARGLLELGFRAGDVFSFCMPNIPETVILIYAVNRLGGICNMIHPLAPASAVIDSVTEVKSKFLAFPEIFLKRLSAPLNEKMSDLPLRKVIVAPMTGSADILSRIGFWVSKGYKALKQLPQNEQWVRWNNLIKNGKTTHQSLPAAFGDPHRVSVYLHSGGTTANPKIIELSDYNFNAIACQIFWAVGEIPGTPPAGGHAMITVLPLFHGFGLCIGMHAMLVNGQCCILVPQFSADKLAAIIKKQRPTLMAGVPTLYEAILHSEAMADVDFSCFKALFCGGDSLPAELKVRFDQFLRAHGSSCKLREGFGLTETVTVCSLTHEVSSDRHGIGVPLSCMEMKIVDPATKAVLPDGETGEICVTGPTVMKGYLNDPEATAKALVLHDDGKVWVETGDLGQRDTDGFYHFISRIKRMIKVSGVPVYPSQIETIVSELPEVLKAAAIGIPHPYKMQVVKVFVSVREGADRAEVEKKIKDTIGARMLRYAIPEEIEFVDAFPLTAVGKIDIKVLEEIEREKRNADNNK